MGFQFLRLIIANEIIKIKYRICQSAIYFCLNLLIRKELSPLNILKLVKWNNQLTICTNLTQSLVLLISLMRITREVLMRKKGLEIIGTPKGWWVHLIIQVLTIRLVKNLKNRKKWDVAYSTLTILVAYLANYLLMPFTIQIKHQKKTGCKQANHFRYRMWEARSSICKNRCRSVCSYIDLVTIMTRTLQEQECIIHILLVRQVNRIKVIGQRRQKNELYLWFIFF